MLITDYNAGKKELTLPTKIGDYTILCGNISNETVKKLVIPKDFQGFVDVTCSDDVKRCLWDWNVFPDFANVEEIVVEEGNAMYMFKEGGLLSKNGKHLYTTCLDKNGEYTIPDSVETISEGAFKYNHISSVSYNTEKLSDDYVKSFISHICKVKNMKIKIEGTMHKLYNLKP